MSRLPSHAVRITGGLLPGGLLEKVGEQDGSLEATGPSDYFLAPGERLGEAITRSWNRLLGLWKRFAERLDQDGALTGPTRQEWLLPLFQELGFGQLVPAPGFELGGKPYPISHLWEATPLHLVGAGVDLDRRTPGVAGAASASPHGLVQEFLNRSEDHLWAIVSNGRQLRLVRDNATLTRTAYVEFDLQEIFAGDDYAGFAVLWLTCHASRLEGPAGKQILERWREQGHERGIRALNVLRNGVEQAIETLGSAVVAHPDNVELLRHLDDRTLEKQELYRQLLRVVYRFLFLLVAESRDLLLDPDADVTARRRYERDYSITRLRALSEVSRGGAHGDLWRQHLVVAHALERSGAPALGLLPLGGFVWSRSATSALEDVTIANEALLTAIRSLTEVTPPGEPKQRVDYANLGAEELGSVYESLLEYEPRINPVAGTFELTTAAGNERKTTGSYYTPTSLIDELLNSALDPVLDEAARAADPEQAILALKVVDPAAGSGHFLIAAANRIADRLARVRIDGDEPSPSQLSAALRDVIAHCIYAVDINPMAVELAKFALWVASMDAGKPLSFLDHHIVCGNSLLGVTPKLLDEGVPDVAFKALTGDDKAVVTKLKARNRTERRRRSATLVFGSSPADDLRHAAEVLAEIDGLGDDIVAIAEKERRYRSLTQSDEQRRLRLAADAWVAAFVGTKADDAPEITSAIVEAAIQDATQVPDRLAAQIADIADRLRFHHWHIAFPGVFSVDPDADTATGWTGGFDVVLGNPPWERVKLQEKEFFASSAPDIVNAPNKAARSRLIKALETEWPGLWLDFRNAVHDAEAISHFLRTSGVYPLCGRGDVNTYTVFAETMRTIVGSAGRVGVIVPTGIATDDTTKHFFADLVDRGSLVSLDGFYDRKQIFKEADVHGFCLLTISGLDVRTAEPEFVFFARSIEEMRDPERRFTLTPDDFALLNPNTRTCPIFRTRRDAEITKGIYRRVPVLVDETREDGNPWGIKFQRMFDMSNDSHLFRTRDQLESEGWTLQGNVFHRGDEEYLPLYEAKMIHHYNHRWATYDGASIRDSTIEERRVPSFAVRPRYWVREADVHSNLLDSQTDWLLGLRDIARATDERTLIASVLPVSAVGNNLPLINPTNPPAECLAALLSSFVVDFVARSKVGGTHVNFFIAEQLAVLPPAFFKAESGWGTGSVEQWFEPRIWELTYTSDDLASLYSSRDQQSGRPFRWNPDRRAALRAELDAAFFHLYGVQGHDVSYIMDTFPVIRQRDIAEHGSFRTKALVLDAYNRLAQAIETAEPYQTTLDPPPGDPSRRHAEMRR